MELDARITAAGLGGVHFLHAAVRIGRQAERPLSQRQP